MAGRQPKRLRADLFLARGSRLGSETETETETENETESELETGTESELGSESLSGAGTETGDWGWVCAWLGNGGCALSLSRPCVSWVEGIAVESEKGSSAFLVS